MSSAMNRDDIYTHTHTHFDGSATAAGCARVPL